MNLPNDVESLQREIRLCANLIYYHLGTIEGDTLHDMIKAMAEKLPAEDFKAGRKGIGQDDCREITAIEG